MSKQNTRSKSKQGQANNKQALKTNSNGATGKTNSAATNVAGGSSTSTKAGAAPSTTTSTTPRAVSTQPKPATGGAAKSAQPAAVAYRPGSKSKQQQRKQQRIENRLVQQRHDARQRRTTIILVAVALVAALGLLGYFLYSNATSSSGETVFNPDYPPISGVYCDQLEQTAYHHHVLLTIYIDGQQVTVPAGVGLAGSTTSPTCYYWLHTHDTSGIIHIEAPQGGNYSLQNFLSVWQSFANTSSSIIYPSQLASSAGWTAYINGKKVNEDFSHIDISSNAAWHELITIMYNSPDAKPVTTYSWQQGL